MHKLGNKEIVRGVDVSSTLMFIQGERMEHSHEKYGNVFQK